MKANAFAGTGDRQYLWKTYSLCAATRLLEDRADMQLTDDEWDALAKAVMQRTGQYIQWRTDDELKPE